MCIKPRAIIDKDGTERFVACGKCWECRRRRANNWVRLCNAEFDNCNGNCVFLTLTYSNDNVNWEYIKPDFSLPSWQELRSSVRKHYAALLPKERRYIDAHPHLQYCKDVVAGWVPSFPLDDSDTRLWIKRCRVYLQRHCTEFGLNICSSDDTALRFSLVGEYGGVTLRPHYHVLLFSSVLSPEFFESFVKTVMVPDWEKHFGRVDYAGKAREGKALTTYVSKYLYKTDIEENPYLLFGNVAPPPFRHSNHMGAKYQHYVKSKFDVAFSNLSQVALTDSVDNFPSQWEIQGSSSQLDDFVQAWQMAQERPLLKALDKLYNASHEWVNSSAGLYQVSIPDYFVKRLWPQRDVTRLTVCSLNDVNSRYNFTFEGYSDDPHSLVPAGYMYCSSARTRVQDCSHPLYVLYLAYLRARYVADNFKSIKQFLQQNPDYLFGSFSDLLNAFRDYRFTQRLARNVSSQSQYISDCRKGRMANALRV